MEDAVIFAEHQQVTTTDANNLGQFPRSTIDHLMTDLGPGFKYTGFASTITATTKVTVGAGRLYSAEGPVYYNDDAGGTELDFIANLPVVAKRFAAIVAWGIEIDTDTQPRTFITNVAQRTTEARVTSTRSSRHANVQFILGVEGADPDRPTVASNYLVIAWVILNTTGVESVVMEDTNRARSIEDLDADIGLLNAWRTLFGQRLDTLATELAALAARINGLAPMDVLLRLIVDVVRLKEKADLPDTYSAWSSDYFLDASESEPTHVDYLARIEEGIRFSHAAENTVNLELVNPIDSNVMVDGSDFMLPRYREIRRLANVATTITQNPILGYEPVVVWDYVTYYQVVGPPGIPGYKYGAYYQNIIYRPIYGEVTNEIAISQFASQTFTYRKHYPVRYRVRWGAPYYWSSRINFWWNREYDPIYWAFWRGVPDVSWLLWPGPPYDPFPKPGLWAWQYGWTRTNWFWSDYVTDYYYWDRIETSHTVNGSVMSQTFLNSQDGWLTGFHLFFSRKANAGDVYVLLCETYENGQPNAEAVLAVSATLPPSAIQIWPKPTRIQFTPTLIQQGKRYAIVMLTQGNHYVATTEANQLTNGTLFYSTDSAWFQGLGDMSRDICFEAIFAEFEDNHVSVQIEPATLSGGIAAVDINADAIIPAGTTLTFEGQVAGDWVPLDDPGPDATTPVLVGLPPLINMRITMQGTTGLMPGIYLGNRSRMYTWRGRSDFTHISELRTMPGAVTKVIVTLRLENWRDTPHHSCTCKLLRGAGYTTEELVDVVVDEFAPDDPNALIRKLTFSGLPSITTYKIKITGTTDNVLTPFHVAERVDIGLA
jgi:hypothetical protein